MFHAYIFFQEPAAPSTANQSPSILKKRKRTSINDLNESKKQRRVSFSDQFFEPANSRSSRLSTSRNVGTIKSGLSPQQRRMSRSGRMLQMANEGSVQMLDDQTSDDKPKQIIRLLSEMNDANLCLSDKEVSLQL